MCGKLSLILDGISSVVFAQRDLLYRDLFINRDVKVSRKKEANLPWMVVNFFIRVVALLWLQHRVSDMMEIPVFSLILFFLLPPQK